MNSIPLSCWSLFRFSEQPRGSEEPESDDLTDADVPGIRCPLCKWRPKSSDSWMCWDWDHPEYYYGGCGTEWNTFETEGLCPTCLHRWMWTSCLNCFVWSRHEDWYEKTND